MDDSDEPEKKKTQDPLINTRHSSSRRELQWSPSRTSEWSFKWALCRGRSWGPPVKTTGREEKKNCSAHSMLEQERPNGSLRYESESKSKSLHTLENIRRVPTQVTWLLFPELLLLAIMSLPVSSPHLRSSSFFSCQTKTPLIIAEYKREEAEQKKKKKINGSILEEDKTLLGFNYFPLVALRICLPLNSEVKTPLNTYNRLDQLISFHHS